MYIFENRIKIEDKEKLNEYLRAYRYNTSGLSFFSLYMWRDVNYFSWLKQGQYALISGMSYLDPEEDKLLPFMFPPLTKTGRYDKGELAELLHHAKEIFEAKGHHFNIRLLPKHMIPIIESACPGEFVFVDDRPNHDYVYLKENLATLSGRAYSSKRNHLNFFLRNYTYTWRDISFAMQSDIMEFLERFSAHKNDGDDGAEILDLEQKAMVDVFANIDQLDAFGGGIYINGVLQALAVGSYNNEDTVVEHIEKANSDFRGLYQLINKEFCMRLPDDVVYVNREEDVGLENLRKSKLSLNPHMMIEKHIAVPRRYCEDGVVPRRYCTPNSISDKER